MNFLIGEVQLSNTLVEQDLNLLRKTKIQSEIDDIDKIIEYCEFRNDSS